MKYEQLKTFKGRHVKRDMTIHSNLREYLVSLATASGETVDEAELSVVELPLSSFS
jgi:hypothetical protein